MNSSDVSPLRTLFLTEAILKVIGGSIFIFSPSTIFSNLSTLPQSGLSTSLIRNFGTQTIAFSIPLFLAARGTSKERKLVYWTLLAREGCLTIGLIGSLARGYYTDWKAGSGKGRTEEPSVDAKALEEGRAQEEIAEREDDLVEERKLRSGLWMWLMEVAPFVVARVWILKGKEEWF